MAQNLDLEEFIRLGGTLLDDCLAELENGQVRSWIVGADWIAGFLVGTVPCFAVGGPTITDEKIYDSLESALGALAWHRQRLRLAQRSLQFRLHKPAQREIGNGSYFLKIVGAPSPKFLAIGPTAPVETLFDDDESAHNAAYEASRSQVEP